MLTIEELGRSVGVIAFAGDWHGNLNYANRALHHAKKNGADVVLHVGDFGYWPNDNGSSGFQKAINMEAERLDLHVLWVDGNHENHILLNEKEVSEDGTRKFYERVWHLPRGFRWEWTGVTFMSMGGAHSVDRTMRSEGFDWFDEEHISIDDMYRAVQGEGFVDVMVTHDCPNGVLLPLRSGSWIPQDDLKLSNSHREVLGKVVDEVQPRYIFHGHYHVSYTNFRKVPGKRTALVRGLDCDGSSFDKNMAIVNIVDFM